LIGYQQERTIPPSDPRLSVRSGHQCGGFFLGEELNLSSLKALRGNCENALALEAECWLSESDESEEGMKCGETMIACTWPVSSITFQVFEERFQELDIEVLEAQSGWRATETLRCELQEEAESVTVARDRMLTGAQLGYQPVGEEVLNKSRKV